MSHPKGKEIALPGIESGLRLVTLRNLTRYLADTHRSAGTEQALICFGYHQPDARPSSALAVLLEQIAHAATLGGCGSGVIAMSEGKVLCFRGDCPPRTALAFARIVRCCLRAVRGGVPGAPGGAVSIGVVAIVAGREDARALVELAHISCQNASCKGDSYIEVYRGARERGTL